MNLDAIIERLNAFDVKIRSSIFIAAVLLFAAADFFLIIQFQLGGIAKLDSESSTVSSDIAHVETEMQRFTQTKKNLDASLTAIKNYTDKIRPRSQSSAVLEDIARLANESQVSIDQLSPSKDGQETLKSPKDVKYYAVPIVIGAHAGYHKFGRFLNKIENNNLLVLMRDLHMEGGAANPDNLAIQATLKIILWDTATEPKK